MPDPHEQLLFRYADGFFSTGEACSSFCSRCRQVKEGVLPRGGDGRASQLRWKKHGIWGRRTVEGHRPQTAVWTAIDSPGSNSIAGRAVLLKSCGCSGTRLQGQVAGNPKLSCSEHHPRLVGNGLYSVLLTFCTECQSSRSLDCSRNHQVSSWKLAPVAKNCFSS